MTVNSFSSSAFHVFPVVRVWNRHKLPSHVKKVLGRILELEYAPLKFASKSYSPNKKVSIRYRGNPIKLPIANLWNVALGTRDVPEFWFQTSWWLINRPVKADVMPLIDLQ
jgi:hypothetical protein